MEGRTLVVAVLVVALAASGAGFSVDDVEVELVGFVTGLPEAGVSLPLSAATTARLEIPNEQGGARVAFTIELTSRTELSRDLRRLRNDQIVVLEGVLRPGRLWGRRLHEADIAEYSAASCSGTVL